VSSQRLPRVRITLAVASLRALAVTPVSFPTRSQVLAALQRGRPRATTRRLLALVAIVAVTLGGVRWGLEMKRRRDSYLWEAFRYSCKASMVDDLFRQVPPNVRVAQVVCDEPSNGGASYEHRPNFPGLNREQLEERYRPHAEIYKRIELAYRRVANFPWMPPPVFDLPPPFYYYVGTDEGTKSR
jgi:hypothetical protein